MPETSAIKNLCSPKNWAKVHENRLRPSTPKTTHHAKFHRDRSNQLGEERYNFFYTFQYLGFPGGPPGRSWLDQGSPVWVVVHITPPLANWKISSSSDDPSPIYLCQSQSILLPAWRTDKQKNTHTLNDMSPHYGDNNSDDRYISLQSLEYTQIHMPLPSITISLIICCQTWCHSALRYITVIYYDPSKKPAGARCTYTCNKWCACRLI